MFTAECVPNSTYCGISFQAATDRAKVCESRSGPEVTRPPVRYEIIHRRKSTRAFPSRHRSTLRTVSSKSVRIANQQLDITISDHLIMHLLPAFLFSSLAYAGVHRLSKRTLPPLEDFPDNDAANAQKANLQSALPDAITLAATVSGTQLSYQDVWDKYFPRDAQQAVQGVWNNIISDTSNPGTGTDTLKNAIILGFDFASDAAQQGLSDDFCAQGYDAYTAQVPTGPWTLPTSNCEPTGPASTPTCGPYDMSVDDAESLNQQLDTIGADGISACCAQGNGCWNVVTTDNVAIDLCSSNDNWQCVDCARMANYAAGLISTCQQDGNVGGSQDIIEAPGLSIAI
ncbi:hypothetical protein M8818_000007 [Zalaria obscura]|uniref:Uncharacterized protein n=1 Tax=Zalaria obscura TaxID=2024903 RepID=A0ACC3SQS6_9PEZI